MAARGRHVFVWTALAFALGLAGCGQPPAPPAEPTRPAAVVLAPPAPRPEPSPRRDDPPLRDAPLATSEELSRRYQLMETRLIGRGFLRDDGGDISALTAGDLATNFLRIALFDEYTTLDGQLVPQESVSRLRRWDAPVRIEPVFGASVSEPQRAADRAEIGSLAASLQELSGHPVDLTDSGGNFFVYVVSEAERLALRPDLRGRVPGITDAVMTSMLDILPSTFCLVVAFSTPEAPQTYTHAVAIVRAEHPPRLRSSCFNEELAQGLGLANDSRAARPSIFNDDEEFALLTRQDRLLVRMLYDPRLRPGMGLAEADAPVRTIAAELIPPPVAAAPAAPPPEPAPPADTAAAPAPPTEPAPPVLAESEAAAQ